MSLVQSSHSSPAKPLVPAISALTERLAPLAQPLVRVATGLFLVPHGAQKLFGWFGGYGLEATGQFFATKLGLPASLALVAGLIEFVGGLLLVVGLLTRPIATLVAGLMVVAAITVHLPMGFFWTGGGYEYPLFWAFAALSVVFAGGGRYSLDSVIGYEI